MAPQKEKETKHLAADFIRIAERYYTSWPTLIARSFVAGVVTALGATLGFAIVIWVAGFILDSLGVLPVVGDFFAQLNSVLHDLAQN